MRRIDQDERERYWNVLVYGENGSGKSSLGVTAQRLGPTLVLLSERQGMNPIREAAKRLNLPIPAVALMEDTADYRAIANALHGDKAQPFRAVGPRGEVLVEMAEWPVTVVIDSLTDAIGNMMVASIRKMSPQKLGDDGLPADADRFHNVLTDKANNFITEFRDCPVNMLFLALLDDKQVGKGKDEKRRIGPKFPNKNIGPIASSACNVVGMAYRTMDAGRPVFQVATLTPAHVVSKHAEPLRAIEVPDFGEWVTRLNNHSAPSTPVELAVSDDLESSVQVTPPATSDTPLVGATTAATPAAGANATTTTQATGPTGETPIQAAKQEEKPRASVRRLVQ